MRIMAARILVRVSSFEYVDANGEESANALETPPDRRENAADAAEKGFASGGLRRARRQRMTTARQQSSWGEDEGCVRFKGA
jgi:hypothetical protein